MREPHMLSPTKTVRMPKRMVFFDSEAEVDIEITDEEIHRTEQGEKVTKEHRPYLICADFYQQRRGKPAKEETRDYYAAAVKGIPWAGGHDAFLSAFWDDVEAFTRVNEKVYVFAHNAKYDVQVTGGVTQLVRLGYTATAFSDANPFFLEMTKLITHSPKTGEEYGEVVPEKKLPPLPKGKDEYPEHRMPRKLRDGWYFVPQPKVKTIMIISSTNYYQQSLKKLGDVFGLPKLDFDHEDEFTQEKALTYCRRDVAILKAAMMGFIQFVGADELGSFSITVAGQAFGAYRHRFMPEETIYIHADDRALRVERDAYAGGRTECFWMGEVPGRVYYVDVNSMYPHVMKDKLYPVELITFWEKASVENVKEKIMDDYLICCDARINTEIPVFHKKRNRLIFPVGDYWTSLSTPELIYAINNDLLIDVKNVAIYRAEQIFVDYVNYFYNERLKAKKKGDAVHDFLYKIFLNSLYGKFGQRNEKWEPIDEAEPDKIDYIQIYHADTKEWENFKVFGGKVWKKKTDEDAQEAFNSFPAIAAHVTAYARMMLWDAIETAGRENVFYCDTDSLFTNDVGYLNLWLNNQLDNDELGKLKLEDFGKLELFGCKDYIFESETRRDKKTGELIKANKIKGISKSAKKLPDSPAGKLRFAVTQWGGFSDRLRDKDFTHYYNKVIIKELKRDYNKGIVEGNKIIPYQLSFTSEELERAELEKEKMREALQDKTDLFANDYFRVYCETIGFIKVIKPGDMYFGEYQRLPEKIKMKYFRRMRGISIDEFAEGIGSSVRDVFDQLNSL